MERRWLPVRQEGTWKVRCYTVGQTVEKIKFRVPDAIAQNREKTRREIARQERKAGQGMRAVCRMVNASFYRTDGVLLELTYTDEAIGKLADRVRTLGQELTEDTLRDQAERELELWLRRVRRARAKGGACARYFAITSDRNGKTGEPARLHHHVIVDPDSAQACADKWRCGEVRAKRLWDEPDHNDLVAYLLRQVRAGKDEKRYKPSRNLIHPVPDYERTVHSDAELRVPAGCSLLERAENSRIEPQYIRYVKLWEVETKDAGMAEPGRRLPVLQGGQQVGDPVRGAGKPIKDRPAL